MSLQRARRQRTPMGVLALLALLMLALAPTLWRVQAASDPLAWVPVCTAGGLVKAQTQPDGTPMPNPAEWAMAGDGACCTLQVYTLALPPAEVVPPLTAHGGPQRHFIAPAAQRGVLPWVHAQARAPPAV